MTHIMNLFQEPFEMIKSGRKTIELRLNDEKRQKLKIGDIIEFHKAASDETLCARITALHQYNSFSELYASLPLLKCGYTEKDIASAKPGDMDAYYSTEQQEKYGALGIEIKVI